MTINTTRWTPDTCSNPPCILEYTWDSSVDNDLRIHTFSTYINKCSLHSSLNDKDAYLSVIDHNTRKNVVAEILCTHFPSLTTKDSNGNLHFKHNLYQWFYDTEYVLNIVKSPLNLTPSQLTQIQSLADEKFGLRKVKII